MIFMNSSLESSLKRLFAAGRGCGLGEVPESWLMVIVLAESLMRWSSVAPRLSSHGLAQPTRVVLGLLRVEYADEVLLLVTLAACVASASLFAAFAASAALAARRILPPTAAVAAVTGVRPAAACILALVAGLRGAADRRGLRATRAVHGHALDGEALGFESFTEHAKVRFKQDACLGRGGREIGNNCALRDAKLDAKLPERGWLEAHRDRASALVREDSKALGGKLARGPRVEVRAREIRSRI
jgi:hypothetical protein